MNDFLMRDEAPLSAEEWAALDNVVVGTAKKLLVGRRLIEIFGPLGAGFQTVPVNQYRLAETVDVAKRGVLAIPVLQQDFILQWQDIAQSRQLGWPLEVSPAAASAAMIARREDEMIFGELLKQAGTKVKNTAWDKPGAVFAALVDATAKLAAKGFFGPYAVVVSPAVYAMLYRPLPEQMGLLEIKQVKELASGGVYQTPALKGNQALVISQGVQNFDLALAQDLVIAYLGPDRMEHLFRVMESLALRVKLPDAIYAVE